MRVCKKCGKAYSDKIFKLHYARCNPEPVEEVVEPKELTEEEWRAKGKELGIQSYHNKGLEKLIAEIQEKELIE